MNDSFKANASAPGATWVDRRAPATLRPWLKLARVDRPIGVWLLMWPCWWSAALAAEGAWPDPRLLVLFAIGAFVMRSAGCVVNDIMDRDIDAKVARTRTRPLASGVISLPAALVFLALLLLIGLAVLTQLDRAAIVVGAASLGLVALYPFMKRITYWPQLFLGFAFNGGALVGWAAVRGELGLPALILYAGGIAWTIGYDTIYAHQDKTDDLAIGVKSTALRFADKTKSWVAGFYAIFMAGLIPAGVAAGLAWPFYVVLVGAAGHFVWQVATADLDDPASCSIRFVSNCQLGLIVFAAIVAGQVAAG
jgi:4-hydroxybenzoate polyprenyltransferase